MDNIGIHEFIWTNTNTEISGQGYYIGAELQHNSVLTFYLVIPSKNICEIIKSYLIPNTLSRMRICLSILLMRIGLIIPLLLIRIVLLYFLRMDLVLWKYILDSL